LDVDCKTDFFFRLKNGMTESYTERTVLLKYLKISLDTDLKIILLDHQNNSVEYSSWMSKLFAVLPITLEHPT